MQDHQNQCPAWDQFILPVLELASSQEITRKLARAEIPKILSLSDEIKEQRLNSGARRVDNRIGWAMSHLTKAGLIQKVKQATYAITEKGSQFLAKYRNQSITYHQLQEVEGYHEAWAKASEQRQARQKPQDEHPKEIDSTTPDERIEASYNELNDSLADELLEAMYEMNPYKFEQLVVDLLFSMGYGGSREEAARVTQKSNDGGIDGIINEDRLGLDVIYVQAKRYQAASTIGRKEIQSFVGALAGKQANKGVFITTSDFKKTATEYAETVTQKVILINGLRLADLMIEHNIGVSTQRTLSLKRMDTDYFEEA
ncbi:MAG: restriction endonuclease [Akkermansiaceae bacterium]